MQTRQLEAFLATVRSGSASLAARRLGISQPSVSRLLSDLERAVGFRLFARTGRTLVPTREARNLLPEVERVLAGLERLRDTAVAIRERADEALTLGTIAVVAQGEMLQALGEIHDARPALRLHVSVRTNESIIDAVRMQEIDLGVVSSLHSIAGLHVWFESTLPYMCLVPASHNMAEDSGPIDLEQLEAEEFVSLPAVYLDALGTESDTARRIARQSRISSHSIPAVANIARVAGMPALVDPFTARNAVALGGVVSRPVVQDMQFPLAIVSRGEDTLTATGKELAMRLKRYLAAS